MPTTPNPLAVVTGASSGIGLAIARELACRGHDLLVAADSDAIEGAAEDLRALGTAVEAVQVDLATADGVETLAARARAEGRVVDVLALNAGRGAGGGFAGDTPLEDELEVVDLNVRSTVHLAKRLVPGMVALGRGRVLVTSSIAATMPGAFQAVYNASKAFTQSFALALREELRDTGVTVTVLMPGPTDTRFFARADMLDTRIGAGDKDDPELVARQAVDGLLEGDERVEAGSLSSRAQGRLSRFLPDSLKGRLHGRLARPGSAATTR